MAESGRILARAAGVGAACLAIGAAAMALVLSLNWAAQEHGSFLMALLMLLFALVPGAAIAGALAGLAFGPLAQWLVGRLRIDRALWPLVDALTMAIGAFLVVLPWAAWVAGGVLRALDGRQGVYGLLVPAAIAGAIGGALCGVIMRRHADASSVS